MSRGFLIDETRVVYSAFTARSMGENSRSQSAISSHWKFDECQRFGSGGETFNRICLQPLSNVHIFRGAEGIRGTADINISVPTSWTYGKTNVGSVRVCFVMLSRIFCLLCNAVICLAWPTLPANDKPVLPPSPVGPYRQTEYVETMDGAVKKKKVAYTCYSPLKVFYQLIKFLAAFHFLPVEVPTQFAFMFDFFPFFPSTTEVKHCVRMTTVNQKNASGQQQPDSVVSAKGRVAVQDLSLKLAAAFTLRLSSAPVASIKTPLLIPSVATGTSVPVPPTYYCVGCTGHQLQCQFQSKGFLPLLFAFRVELQCAFRAVLLFTISFSFLPLCISTCEKNVMISLWPAKYIKYTARR